MTTLDTSSNTYQILTHNLHVVLKRALKKFAPPPKMTTLEWARAFRFLAPEQSSRPGKYRDDITPWVKFWLAALDDPKIRKVICLKSAQTAWTDGALGNFLFRRMHIDPCSMIVLFPKEKTIRKFRDQKVDPSIKASPALRTLIDVSTSRSSGNRMDYVKFPGGFLSLVASNAPDNIKSQSAPVVAVEEPDDCNDDVGGQGDSVSLLEQRAKTFPNRKVILGGTPTIAGHSRIQKEYKRSNQTVFMVPCHHCGEAHVLSWDHVACDTQQGRNHELYGDYLPETAYYLAPCCGERWSDKQKNQNVQKLYPVVQNPSVTDVAGFYINELYSPFDGSKLGVLMARYLEAERLLEQGDETEMISFVNNTCGEAYEYKDGAPDIEVLRDKAEDYPELTVPHNGLMITIGVDVQPDRLAIVIRAWGRGEESWLLWWGEILAKNNVSDVTDPVWTELDRIIFGRYHHSRFGSMAVKAAGIDSGGSDTDAVYHYVRSRRNRGVKVRAIKGSNNLEAPITCKPKKIDLSSTSKAARFGLELWMVGVEQGKDLIAGRLKLTGNGPGRMHCYQGVRYDYHEQLLGESKIPSRKHKGRKKWTKKSGARVEALDCENYAMHAARTERIHLWKEDRWSQHEASLMQNDLLVTDEAEGDLVTRINEERQIGVEPETATDETIATAPLAEAPASTEPKAISVKQPTSTPRKRSSLADLGRKLMGR